MRQTAWRVAGIFSLVLVLVAIASDATAATYTVVNDNSTGPGSLADAIAMSNQTSGPNEIRFNIPGAGVRKIDVSKNTLPPIGVATTIDGYTQPGAKANDLAVGDDAVILIQIDGGNTANYGIDVSHSDCVIRGLSFTGMSNVYDQQNARVGAAIYGDTVFYAVNGVRIEGNFVGVAPDGVTMSGSYWGVLTGTHWTIGGSDPAARNIVAGNHVGIWAGSGSIVAGNYIGTDVSGTRSGYGNIIGIQGANGASPNSGDIGGTASGSGNVVSGNAIGIDLFGPYQSVEGNAIGVAADRTTPLGNVTGIQVDVSYNRIGGLAAGQGNVIAYNDTGIVVALRKSANLDSNNPVLSNQLFGNRVIDIDLNSDGITHNDYQDKDSGPNDLQNFPIISSISRDSSSTTVTGALNSTPSTSFTVQFFATTSGATPGQTLLGTQTVNTNSTGDASFSFTFPVTTASNDSIAATATDPNGNTSELTPQNGVVQLSNISTRGDVLTGEDILIGGFIVRNTPTGNTSRVLIRALGPSVNVSGALPDPRLDLFSGSTLLASNDDWKQNQQQEIQATGLAPTSDKESAIVTNLANGNYTAQVSGVNGDTGIGQVEIYQLDPLGSVTAGELANISTRGFVGLNDNVLIGGIIINGDKPQRTLFRALGPDLANAGVTSPLQDPVLELHDAQGTLLTTNDNWRSNQEQEINATGIPPGDDRDSAIVATLVPSAYTAVVRGATNTTGVALVEAYKLD